MAARAAVARRLTLTQLALRWLPGFARRTALALFGSAAPAAALRYCDRPAALSAEQQDLLLRFGAIVKQALDASGSRVALIARSGLDLSRFGQRYSHAGIALLASANAPWSVRQLYFACDEGRPRLYDQGMAGFVTGTDDAATGYVSALLLPAAAADALEAAALDSARALQLLGSTYSANAYAFGLRYQNCNQWVAEMLATAWQEGVVTDATTGEQRRAQAQQWLRDQGYVPSRFELGNPALLLLGTAIPWIHNDDHPANDVARLRYEVSMPASIEAFVQARLPGARRIELCHAGRRVVLHRGWEPIADGCRPAAQDEVISLDD